MRVGYKDKYIVYMSKYLNIHFRFRLKIEKWEYLSQSSLKTAARFALEGALKLRNSYL